MKLSLTATLSFAFALAVSAPAEAASITFLLDCKIDGPGECTPTTPGAKGTVTLTDNATNSSWLDVSVNVDSGKIKELHLNVNGTPPAGYSFTSTVGGVDYDADGEQADGYNVYLFDLLFAGNNDDPFTTVLKLQKTVLGVTTYFDLNPGHFAAKTADGVFWAAILNNSGEGWLGATSLCPTCPVITPTDFPPGELAAVPEPASLLLLGSGLLGGAWRMRKRRSAV